MKYKKKIIIFTLAIFLIFSWYCKNTQTKDKDVIDTAVETKNEFIRLKRMFNGAGLGKYWKAVRPHLKYSIKLIPQKIKEDKILVGHSKIGGKPDLPSNITWPVYKGIPQLFIAQINCADLQKLDRDSLFPEQGTLYFFYNSQQDTWGFDPKDRGSFKVIYADTDSQNLARREFPSSMPGHGKFGVCRIRFEEELTIPQWDSDIINGLNLSDKKIDKYIELESAGTEDEYKNRVLGYPDRIQGEMRLECQLVTNGLYCGDASGYNDPRRKQLEKGAADWLLLLQIDSIEEIGMMWGDVGRLYYWIKQDDLRNLKFENSWLILQCY